MLERSHAPSTTSNASELQVSSPTISSHPMNASPLTSSPPLVGTDTFCDRHIGANSTEIAQMLEILGFSSLEELITATVPASIRSRSP